MSLLFMSNGGCGEDFTIQTYRVTFENQSGDTIYYAAFNYFPSNKPEDSHYDLQESDIVHVLKNGEQDEFIEAIQEDDTYLCVLVFKKETWRKYGKEGLVKNDPNGFLKLTKAGEIHAKRIYERHTILTQLFIDLGVDPKIAAEDACRIEHYISDETFDAVKAHAKTYGKKAGNA